MESPASLCSVRLIKPCRARALFTATLYSAQKADGLVHQIGKPTSLVPSVLLFWQLPLFFPLILHQRRLVPSWLFRVRVPPRKVWVTQHRTKNTETVDIHVCPRRGWNWNIPCPLWSMLLRDIQNSAWDSTRPSVRYGKISCLKSTVIVSVH